MYIYPKYSNRDAAANSVEQIKMLVAKQFDQGQQFFSIIFVQFRHICSKLRIDTVRCEGLNTIIFHVLRHLRCLNTHEKL